MKHWGFSLGMLTLFAAVLATEPEARDEHEDWGALLGQMRCAVEELENPDSSELVARETSSLRDWVGIYEDTSGSTTHRWLFVLPDGRVYYRENGCFHSRYMRGSVECVFPDGVRVSWNEQASFRNEAPTEDFYFFRWEGAAVCASQEDLIRLVHAINSTGRNELETAMHREWLCGPLERVPEPLTKFVERKGLPDLPEGWTDLLVRDPLTIRMGSIDAASGSPRVNIEILQGNLVLGQRLTISIRGYAEAGLFIVESVAADRKSAAGRIETASLNTADVVLPPGTVFQYKGVGPVIGE